MKEKIEIHKPTKKDIIFLAEILVIIFFVLLFPPINFILILFWTILAIYNLIKRLLDNEKRNFLTLLFVYGSCLLYLFSWFLLENYFFYKTQKNFTPIIQKIEDYKNKNWKYPDRNEINVNLKSRYCFGVHYLTINGDNFTILCRWWMDDRIYNSEKKIWIKNIN
jgi:hypothetical protein